MMTAQHTHTKGVARGTVKDSERCNDSVEEVDEIEVGSRNESVTIAAFLKLPSHF